MLDQSFSLENFNKIFEIENRKGNFETKYYSDKFLDLSNELKKQRKIIKAFKSKGDIAKDDERLLELNEEKKKIEEKKKNELEITLQEYVENVNSKGFKFVFSKFLHEASGKYVYPIGKDASSYFAMKQLQFNINRTFKVKQGNRYLISKQVQSLIKDNFPKIVLRTDIKGFYESVPQERLLNMINDNQLLSPKSKTLIKNLFYSYNVLTDQIKLPVNERKGIPRGAGISAYLAELYMREVDNKIKRLGNVTYYGRYVDDIIVLFTPSWKMSLDDYKNKVEEIISESSLLMNPSKTYPYDLNSDKSLIKIEFLGYVFSIENSEYTGTSISKNKKDRYLSRIEKTIDVFLEQKVFASSEASKLLLHRFNYLTKNTRLHKPKKGLVGIYYSNSLIEKNCKDLEFLDNELHKIIDHKLPSSTYKSLNKKLKEYSFEDGFKNKRFFNINSKKKNIPDLRPDKLKEIKKLDNNFERIISVWK
ncbi:antiviral reverse transcriptase Drt3a [Hanstruepera ponticola]|uniref:antiviral reverse transcriptase Drt3a n=1 Tax=Hanstruepera ponticola TaxID=2042995 RepID=UPI00178074BE|nr:antiviral reverse transcriptase Drt3a [Hanstruepera ponticola]